MNKLQGINMQNHFLKNLLVLLALNVSVTVAHTAVLHDKLAADCKAKIDKDVRADETVVFCLNAESVIAKESPNSAAHVAVLTHLGLASGYSEKLGKSSTRGYYEKLVVVAEAGFGKGSVETIEPLLNLAALDSDAENWRASRANRLAALEASTKYQSADSERRGSILSGLATNYREEKSASPETYKVADAAAVQKKLAENTEARFGLKKYETGIEWLNFGALAFDAGDKAEAKRATEKALQILIDSKGGSWIEIAKKQLAKM
jgi:hypothetical protein